MLELDKQNELKTSQIKEYKIIIKLIINLATTEQAAASILLRRPCGPRLGAFRCLLTTGTGSAYPVWRKASTNAKKREKQRLGNMISSFKFLIKDLQLYRGRYITTHFPRTKMCNGFVINRFTFGDFLFFTKTAPEDKDLRNFYR